MLIKIKNGPQFLTIREMEYLAMCVIFEREKVSREQQELLTENISFWSKCAEMNDCFKKDLQRIVNALIANDEGYFDRAKQQNIELKLDWRKRYRAGMPNVDVEGRTSFSKS